MAEMQQARPAARLEAHLPMIGGLLVPNRSSCALCAVPLVVMKEENVAQRARLNAQLPCNMCVRLDGWNFARERNGEP
jgi:hypothetical protein